MTRYQPRKIRFERIIEVRQWRLKYYSLIFDSSSIDEKIIRSVELKLETWLKQADNYKLTIYHVGTLIIHKWRGGYFAIINWWTDENMLQHFVYLATNDNPTEFNLFSDKGIVTCIWELEILWFERNAWVNDVLKKEINAINIDKYLHHKLTQA